METDLLVEQQNVSGVKVSFADSQTGVQTEETIKSSIVVLAIGHSARDTFAQLVAQKVELVPKAFAIGVRIEHPQSLINLAQYGEKYAELPILGAADYKLTYHLLT